MKPELYFQRLPDGRYEVVKNGRHFETSPNPKYNTNEELLNAVLTALTSEEIDTDTDTPEPQP